MLGLSYVEIGVINLIQHRSRPMTEQSISPLCQRMIENTSVRGLGHTKLHTTARYRRVASNTLRSVKRRPEHLTPDKQPPA